MQTRGHRLALSKVVKRYRDNVVLNDVTLEVPGGALLTLLGPSGCGKSTLLRVIAGLTEISAGRVLIGDQDITATLAHKRNVGLVFQSYALFPHMQISQNVAFGLRMRRIARDVIAQKVSEVLGLVQLAHLSSRYPAQLSGGQQQRAALARVLVTEPRILLLDEPFGALDRSLRERMQLELRKLQQSLGITTIVVTHDQEEALVLSDYTAVMQNGRIEQFGTPAEIYDRPNTKFVAEFIGRSNVLAGKVIERTESHISVALQTDEMLLVEHEGRLSSQGTVHIMIRPEKVRLLADRRDGPLNGNSVLLGTVLLVRNLGSKLLYEISLRDGSIFMVEQQRAEGARVLAPGAAVGLESCPSDCVVLAA